MAKRTAPSNWKSPLTMPLQKHILTFKICWHQYPICPNLCTLLLWVCVISIHTDEPDSAIVFPVSIHLPAATLLGLICLCRVSTLASHVGSESLQCHVIAAYYFCLNLWQWCKRKKETSALPTIWPKVKLILASSQLDLRQHSHKFPTLLLPS